MPPTSTTVAVTVRFFAAARAAAGVDEAIVVVPGATVDALVATVGAGDPELARVLQRCSFLVDEVAVRDRGAALADGSTVDVLPPFAGG